MHEIDYVREPMDHTLLDKRGTADKTDRREFISVRSREQPFVRLVIFRREARSPTPTHWKLTGRESRRVAIKILFEISPPTDLLAVAT